MMRLGLVRVILLMGMGTVAAGATDDATTTYRDEAVGLTYRYPSEFQTRPELAAGLARGLASGDSDPMAAKCITLPLGVMKGALHATGEGEIGVIGILKIDHTCMGEPGTKDKLGPAAQLMMKTLSPFGRPVTQDAVYYQLDGHDAAFVQGSAAAKMLGEGRMLHEAAVCSLVGKFTVCWMLIDSEHKLMPGLVANPVMFDGRTPVPLVPKDIPQPW